MAHFEKDSEALNVLSEMLFGYREASNEEIVGIVEDLIEMKQASDVANNKYEILSVVRKFESELEGLINE